MVSPKGTRKVLSIAEDAERITPAIGSIRLQGNMDHTINEFGQPIGVPVPNWLPPPRPSRAPLDGRYCRLVPLDSAEHAASLFAAYAAEPDARGWTYLAYGPFADAASYRTWLEANAACDDPLFFTIVDNADNQPAGVASYLNINPVAGSIEVGHLYFAQRLRRGRAATEAMYLMMQHAFTLGYRRYEWKCNALNAPSRAAAERLGFTFEGLFRQAAVVKGHNRDTAWHSIVDTEWPTLRAAFEKWLVPENFDAAGQQRVSLALNRLGRQPSSQRP
jgi:RimJ/RimL family protein N-acetyltransferase